MPETAPLWGALGLAYARAGDGQAAESAFKTASGLAEDDFWIHLNSGGLLIQLGRFSEALEALSVAMRAERYRTEALELMAYAAARLDESAMALSLLEEAAIRMRDPRVLTSLATLVSSRTESRNLLQEALDLDPAYGPAALNLAILLDRSGEEIHRALHYYERYLAVTPSSEVEPAVQDRVSALRHRRDHPEGMEDPVVLHVREFILRSREAVGGGNRVMALNFATRAAQVAQREGRTDLEEYALRQGVEAAPELGRPHAALGQFYVEHGRYEDALRALREAARLAPDVFQVQSGLARAASLAGQAPLAAEALARAEGLASTGAELDAVAALYRDGLRDRRSARRVEQSRAERFPE